MVLGKVLVHNIPLEAMLEKWKGAVDDKKVFGAILTDLSKAFDCLSRELIIAKLKPTALLVFQH